MWSAFLDRRRLVCLEDVHANIVSSPPAGNAYAEPRVTRATDPPLDLRQRDQLNVSLEPDHLPCERVVGRGAGTGLIVGDAMVEEDRAGKVLAAAAEVLYQKRYGLVPK